jgi:hypothetical protein
MLGERRRIRTDISCDEVVGYNRFEKVEPEDRKLSEHNAFVRNSVRHNDIESRNAVGGDDQQFVFDRINVSYLAAPKKFYTGNASLRDRINSLSSSAWINLSIRVEQLTDDYGFRDGNPHYQRDSISCQAIAASRSTFDLIFFRAIIFSPV